MERFQSLRKAQKIDKTGIDINIISATEVLGSKHSKQFNKYQIKRSQQISLDNKRWIVFNIDDKNSSNIPLIQRKAPQLMKENTEAFEKKSCKNHQKNHKFQLSFSSLDNNIRVNGSFIQANSKCSSKNVNLFKNIISLRSMKKEVALTECSSYQSPNKQLNKPSIYKYLDKPSKSNKSNSSLLRLKQESLNKSQIKSKNKEDISQKGLNKRKNQQKTKGLKEKKPIQQYLKQQVKQIVNKINQRQIQFLMLFDPIQLLQRHAQARNKIYNMQQRLFWKEINNQQQKEFIKQKQFEQKNPLGLFKSSIIDDNFINQNWKDIVTDYIAQYTNEIVQNLVQKTKQIENIKIISKKQKINIRNEQVFISQNSPTINIKILKHNQNKPSNTLHSSQQQKSSKSQFEPKSFFSQLKAIDNIRIIKLECGIGSSLYPEKIEDFFVNSIPSSSLLHKKYRNDEFVSLLNAIILINPKLIKNIFIPSKNGYSCKLFNLGNFEIVEVDCEFAFDLNYYPIFGEVGQFLWFSVLIKALAIILGSFEAVTLLKAEQAFTIITGQQLHQLDLKDQNISVIQVIQRAQKEKASSDRILMVKKDGIFYSISKLNTKKQKLKQIQKGKIKMSENNQKGEQKCYKSLSQFLKKQSKKYLKKKLYNDTKVELKERQKIHKINFNSLQEEGFEIIVSQSLLSHDQMSSIRKNIVN